MKLLRHYFISDDLDDLELFEQQLEAAGVTTPQIHVLSKHDTDIAHHEHLNYVQSFLKKDVVHSTEIGAVAGVCLAVISLMIAYIFGWTQSAAGWMPFIFLAIIILGFCTWEGGLIGMETPNYNFTRFEEALKNNQHILFIDLKHEQEGLLKKIADKHPKLKTAGRGAATPNWIVVMENIIPKFFKHTFP